MIVSEACKDSRTRGTCKVGESSIREQGRAFSRGVESFAKEAMAVEVIKTSCFHRDGAVEAILNANMRDAVQ